MTTDALALRLDERSGDLRSVKQSGLHRQRPTFEVRRNCLALYQFHLQVVWSYIVERAESGMNERRNRASLALESVAEPFIGGLDRYQATQACVHGAKHFS